MTVGSSEHYEILKEFEKNFSYMRLTRESDKTLWKMGIVYEDGLANQLYKAYQLGYSLGRINYILAS